MNERWKTIPAFPDYRISDLGRVMSIARTIIRKNGCLYRVRERILKQNVNQNGYPCVGLYGGRFPVRVHRLVATAFVINRDPVKFTEVDHIDRRRSNPAAINLRWVSRSGNGLNRGVRPCGANPTMGVSRYRDKVFRRKPWIAYLQNKRLGSFATKVEAIRARLNAHSAALQEALSI